MRVLVITNLFPTAAEPRRGLFNLEQLSALATMDAVRVVCPLPAWPGRGALSRLRFWKPYVTQAGNHNGIATDYPRYPYVPRLGQVVHHRLFAEGVRPTIDSAIETFRPDLIYATWSYPDVVAASRLAARHSLPLVAKVHGTDINDYFNRPRRRRLIVEALRQARAVIAVSSALAAKLNSAGIDSARVHVIPNGVDTARFQPRSREAARARLGIDTRAATVLFVGNLKPVKGIDILLRAFTVMTNPQLPLLLVVVGGGPLLVHLRQMVNALGIDGRVRFVGECAPDEIARWMNAADVLCLPSRSEGMPNVVLEAAASGIPVVASHVGGIPEILQVEDGGFLVPPEDPAALASALERALARSWDPDAVRGAARVVSWSENARKLRSVMSEVLRGQAA